MSEDMLIESDEVPKLEMNEIIKVSYFNSKGQMTEVDGRVVGGDHPRYLLQFTVEGVVKRAVTKER